MPNAVVTLDLSDEFVRALAERILARLQAGVHEGALDGIREAKAEVRRTAQGDPWGGEWPDTPPDDETPPSGASGPPGGGSGGGRSGTVTDNKGRAWSFGLPEAPDCQCGEPAVMVKGKTNGKPWTQYRCAKDFDDYKNKCNFSQFAGGKR
jgi:hypothetical protein